MHNFSAEIIWVFLPAACLGRIKSLPRRSTSFKCRDLLATPKSKCSPAWALNRAT